MGYIYAITGRAEAARKILHQLSVKSEKGYVAPECVAWVYAALGDNTRAVEWLEKAYLDRSPEMVALRMTPQFDPLRSDPRFRNIVRRMNFPQ